MNEVEILKLEVESLRRQVAELSAFVEHIKGQHVEAKSLKIVDAGKTSMYLGGSDRGPLINIFDQDGLDRIHLGIIDGEAKLEVFTKDHLPGAVIQTSDGGIGLTLTDPRSCNQIEIAISYFLGSPMFAVNGKHVPLP